MPAATGSVTSQAHVAIINPVVDKWTCVRCRSRQHSTYHANISSASRAGSPGGFQ